MTILLYSALGQEDVATFLFNYNATAEEKFYSSVVADWEYNTDINAETQQISVSTSGDGAHCIHKKCNLKLMVRFQP